MNLEQEKYSIIKRLQEKLMSDMVEEFAILTNFQRVELLNRFSDFFCKYCGRKQPTDYPSCQCENDE